MDNKKAFNDGMKKFYKLKGRYFMRLCIKACKKISDHIDSNLKAHVVTGNLRGSIAYGIYLNKKLMIANAPFADSIRAQTLKEGEEFEYGLNTKGKPAKYTAPTGTKKYFGDEESLSFLTKYKPSVNGYTIVFVVGVEYAEYREKEEKANALTDTFQFVRSSGEKLFTNKIDFENVVQLPFEMPSDFELPF